MTKPDFQINQRGDDEVSETEKNEQDDGANRKIAKHEILFHSDHVEDKERVA